MLSRKFLQKKEEPKLDDIDQSKKGKGKKNEFHEIDPLGFHEKRLDFRVEFDEIKTPEDKIKDEIVDTRHQTRTTNQFQKLVNAYIKERVEKINNIRSSKSQFDLDIAALKGENLQNPPEKIQSPLFRLSESDVNEVLRVLEIEQKSIKEKLDDYKTKVTETENIYNESKKKIQRLHDHLKERGCSNNTEQNSQSNSKLNETLGE